MDRVLCESSCRAQCALTRSRKDLPAVSVPSRGGTRIRMGDTEIVAPELNFPVTDLAKSAASLRVPLAKPTTTTVTSTDLRPEMSRRGVLIKDQKDTPTCMAHALTSAMEYALVPALRADPALAKRVGAPTTGVNLSRRHAHFVSLHAAIVCQRDNPRGSWVLQAASQIAAEGTFLDSLWPWATWDPTSPRWETCEQAVNGGEPSSKALAARRFFLRDFHYLPPYGLEAAASARNPAHLEGVLALGHPVVLALVLLKEPFEAAWRNGGLVRMPKLGTKTPSTLHYVLVVGYDRARKNFVFANSWGTGFGARGFGFVDYDYVTNYAIEGLFVESLRVRS